MSDGGKKISFSFSKVKKPSLASTVKVEDKEKIDYVDCFDGSKGAFSYKGNFKTDPTKKEELVIPLISQKTSGDIIKLRIEERGKKLKNENLNENNSKEDLKSENGTKDLSKSLEEIAAQEILKDLKNNQSDEKNSNQLIIGASDTANPNEVEADIDYDNVPVSDFGLAMLRGMGWKPGYGIGKEPKVVETVSVKLRPKGLGLGAKPVPETNEKQSKPKPEKS